jgi:hypothetical protein
LNKLIILIYFAVSGALADAAPVPPRSTVPPPKAATPVTDGGDRERSFLNFNLTLISVGEPVPTKYAATVGFNLERVASIEGEYFGGTYDNHISGYAITALKEAIALGRVRFWPTRKRFNVFGGYGTRWLTAQIAGTAATVRSNVVEAGCGQRIDLGALTLGIDWLALYVPIGPARITYDDPLDAMTPDDRRTATGNIDKLAKVPTAAAFKIYAGLNF